MPRMFCVNSNSECTDFYAMLSQSPYQASSIHLRQHLSIQASQQDLLLPEVPPPQPAQSSAVVNSRQNDRAARDRRLLSNLWLMSAATFRRLGKIEQAKGAIQEAEVGDESNPAVWVQVGVSRNAQSLRICPHLMLLHAAWIIPHGP